MGFRHAICTHLRVAMPRTCVCTRTCGRISARTHVRTCTRVHTSARTRHAICSKLNLPAYLHIYHENARKSHYHAKGTFPTPTTRVSFSEHLPRTHALEAAEPLLRASAGAWTRSICAAMASCRHAHVMTHATSPPCVQAQAHMSSGSTTRATLPTWMTASSPNAAQHAALYSSAP